MTRVGVISDTHLPRRDRRLLEPVWRLFDGVDLVIHAGDVCIPSFLDELAGIAPVVCAVGNCDPPEVRTWGARDVVELELDGVKVTVVHDGGASQGRARRLKARFPGSDVLVFGHSHLPLVEHAPGLLLVNPGSALDRRRAPHHTVALLELDGGQASARLVALD